MSRSRSSRRPKVLGVAALLLAVVGVGGATLALRAHDAPASAAAGTSASSVATGATGPATVPAAAPSSPSAHVAPPPDPADVATDTATPDGVSVQITYAGVDDSAGGVVVGAYVAGLVEDGGTCSLVLSQGSRSLSAVSGGSASATTTSCGQLLATGASAGAWTAEVTYTSPSGGAGVRTSASMAVQVP